MGAFSQLSFRQVDHKPNQHTPFFYCRPQSKCEVIVIVHKEAYTAFMIEDHDYSTKQMTVPSNIITRTSVNYFCYRYHVCQLTKKLYSKEGSLDFLLLGKALPALVTVIYLQGLHHWKHFSSFYYFGASSLLHSLKCCGHTLMVIPSVFMGSTVLIIQT